MQYTSVLIYIILIKGSGKQNSCDWKLADRWSQTDVFSKFDLKE